MWRRPDLAKPIAALPGPETPRQYLLLVLATPMDRLDRFVLQTAGASEPARVLAAALQEALEREPAALKDRSSPVDLERSQQPSRPSARRRLPKSLMRSPSKFYSSPAPTIRM